jgi:uncharacterized protein YegL
MRLEDSIEFAENAEPRCACVLLLDTSGSMGGAPIAELNRGLQLFRENLAGDSLASRRVEIAIVTFDNEARLVQDFVTADQFNPPTLTAPGVATCMGAGIQLALDLVQTRKALYRANGVTYYRPWVFLITDGAPSDPPVEIERAAQRVRDDENNKRVSFFAVGVEGANIEALRAVSVKDPVKLTGLNFKDMFVWLSASLQRVSASKLSPGGVQEQVPLQPLGWGTAS